MKPYIINILILATFFMVTKIVQVQNSIENFKNGEDSTEDVEADLSGKGIDIDLGIQTKIYDKSNVYLGFMLEHLNKRLNQNMALEQYAHLVSKCSALFLCAERVHISNSEQQMIANCVNQSLHGKIATQTNLRLT